jgi:hypothetical protein
MRNSQSSPPTKFRLREIAAVALVDVRTLERFFSGGRVRDTSRERIRRALLSRLVEQPEEAWWQVGPTSTQTGDQTPAIEVAADAQEPQSTAGPGGAP